MQINNQLIIRPIEEKDLKDLWSLAFKEEAPEWKKWDAPYYSHSSQTYQDFMKKSDQWIHQENFWAIELDGSFIGILSYYWEDKSSKWLETGIILYESINWGKGIGTAALKLWFQHLFTSMPLVRVGFTTWSGNERMIQVGKKLGMTVEARLRKVRYYNGTYYDSIRMGMFREEWENISISEYRG